MNRVFFDTNAGTSSSGYYLWFEKSKEDLREIKDLATGILVELYMPDEVSLTARLEFDEELGTWVGIPIADAD